MKCPARSGQFQRQRHEDKPEAKRGGSKRLELPRAPFAKNDQNADKTYDKYANLRIID